MSRIRTVKPEFWSSEQIMMLSRDARLGFIGLWNFCDDAGNHPASLKTFKAEVFPGDDDIDVASLLEELIQQRLVIEYEVNGKRFWHVTGWQHQKIDKPSYKHLLPDGTKPNPSDHKAEDIRRIFDEYSRIPRRRLDELSSPERSLIEGKGHGIGEERIGGDRGGRKGEPGKKPQQELLPPFLQSLVSANTKTTEA